MFSDRYKGPCKQCSHTAKIQSDQDPHCLTSVQSDQSLLSVCMEKAFKVLSYPLSAKQPNPQLV